MYAVTEVLIDLEALMNGILNPKISSLIFDLNTFTRLVNAA